jgi:pimeloyl-ACP methyl ester carboxylesterase
MIMQEIIAPELLAGFFIVVSQLRPFIRKLENLEGLIWFPVLALGIIIALFPAYGFRPECIPLLIYGGFFAFFNLPALIPPLRSPRNAYFQGSNSMFQALMFLLVIPVLGIAVFFAPVMDSPLLKTGVTSGTLTDEGRGVELFLRVYGDYDEENAVQDNARERLRRQKRPLLVLIPPVRGSVLVTDRVCGELRDAGFTVAVYSRRGFDSPAVELGRKKHLLSPNKQMRLFWAESRGRATVGANAIGRSLEEERRRDIEFLLGLLRQNKPLPASFPAAIADALAETDRSTVFLAGYDAGGAALLELAGVPDFAARYPAVKGLIAVESPLLSVLTREITPELPPPNDNWFIAIWWEVRSRVESLLPQRITGIGEVPRPSVPVCFILSDRVLEARHRDDRYGTVLKVFHNANAPAILTTADGAGPLDYSDIPEKYPLYRVFRPGRKGSLFRGTHGTKETAALMTNFAASILESSQEGEGGTSPVLPRKPLASQNFHIETNNGWNSLKKGFIL